MINVILLGPPGVGKGTQSSLLAERFDLVHISTGDLLRREMDLGTNLGNYIRPLMDAGQYVGDQIVCDLVEQTIEPHRGIVLDGFPRTIAQADALRVILAKQHRKVDHVIELQADTAVLVQRMLARAEHSGRADDTEEIFEDRLRTYHEKTAPLITYYEDLNLLTKVDSLDEIHIVAQRVQQVVE